MLLTTAVSATALLLLMRGCAASELCGLTSLAAELSCLPLLLPAVVMRPVAPGLLFCLP